MSENYDWKKDPFLDLDGPFDHEPIDIDAASQWRFSQAINKEAANAAHVEALFGKINVYVKTTKTGDAEYDERVKIGDHVVFRRLGWRAQSIDDMDGQVKIVTTNDLIYTVVGKNPPVYGSINIKRFGPAHIPVGPRIKVGEVARSNRERHVTFDIFSKVTRGSEAGTQSREAREEIFKRMVKFMRALHVRIMRGQDDKPKPN